MNLNNHFLSFCANLWRFWWFPEYKKMSIPFTFPNSRENYEVAESVESIKRELKKDADPFSEWKDMFKV